MTSPHSRETMPGQQTPLPRHMPADYAPAADLLADRVLIITGAGDGLGKAAALACAAHGATLILLGRTVPKLEAVYDRIVAAGHADPAIYPMDLLGASPGDHEELAERVASEFGRIDGLLHNAARLGTLTPIDYYDPKLWLETLQINLNAAFFLTRACLPLMKKSPDASIVFTSDAVGRQGRAYWGAYGVSKFGIEGLMQILAQELDAFPSMRVNSLDPGPVRTRLRAAAYPGEDPHTLPEPETLMATYLFLLGPESRGISGEIFAARRGAVNG
ncbi:MAG: YciK family oxidoreductase [Gammaproteobacteria bacterium]